MIARYCIVMNMNRMMLFVIATTAACLTAEPIQVHPLHDLSSPLQDDLGGGVWGNHIVLSSHHDLYVNHVYPSSRLGDGYQNTVFVLAPQPGVIQSVLTASAGSVPGFGHDFAVNEDGTVFVSSQLGTGVLPYDGSVERFDDALINESVSFFLDDDFDYYYYGSALEANDQVLVVNAGDVYGDGVFNARGTLIIQDQETGEELSRLSPKHLPDYAYFGAPGGIALQDNKLLVLAWDFLAPDGTTHPRELFLYDIENPSQPSLQWSIPETEYAFGSFGHHSLAISEEYVFVTRYNTDYFGDNGEAFIQVHNLETGDLARTIELERVEYPKSIQLPSVATHGDLLVVGNPLAEMSSRVSLYRISTGELVYQLQPGELIEWEIFGHAVDVQWPTIVVSAPYIKNQVDEAGSVFVYNLLDDSVCFADMNRDGVLNFFDVSSFLIAFIDGDPRADIDFSGEPSFFDLSYFLQNYKAGCP